MDGVARFSLADGADLLGLSVQQLWWRYLALGGALDRADLAVVITRPHLAEGLDVNLVAQALNEAFLERGVASFPVGYSRSAPDSRTTRADAAVQRRARHLAAVVRARELQVASTALIATSLRLQGLRERSCGASATAHHEEARVDVTG